jgi:hypothetical protein
MSQKPRKLFLLFWYLDSFYDVSIEYLANYKKVIEASQRRKEESDARARAPGFHEMEEEGTEIVCGGVFPRKTRPEFLKGFQGNPVTCLGVRRGIFLAFEIEQELSSQDIVRGSVAVFFSRWTSFLFQAREPIGAASGGCAVSSTFPDFCVPRSKRKMAERDSTPSGETATMGIW